jgi:D-glycero-D-manno-heptose 1,7-bisphosphate phosphatase
LCISALGAMVGSAVRNTAVPLARAGDERPSMPMRSASGMASAKQQRKNLASFPALLGGNLGAKRYDGFRMAIFVTQVGSMANRVDRDRVESPQCAILCGGLGSRLGALTANTPKPLLPVDGEPFLETLIFELGRQGFRDVLLLAGHQHEKIIAFAKSSPAAARFGMTLDVSVESNPAGTGGALWQARNLLAECFLLINGDTWFDIPLLSFWATCLERPSDVVGALALRHVDNAGRYGSVDLDSDVVIGFREKCSDGFAGYINGGIYFLSRQILEWLSPECSLERDVLPKLAAKRRLLGQKFDQAYFIDIGLPETYEQAQVEIPARKTRPVAFLERECVVGFESGHVGSADRLTLVDGAPAAVRRLNEAGYYVVIITHQPDGDQDRHSQSDHLALMDRIAAKLCAHGAHLDDHSFYSSHSKAVASAYSAAHPWRTSQSGVLTDLVDDWSVNLERSFFVGREAIDLEAAAVIGVPGHLIAGSDLAAFISTII